MINRILLFWIVLAAASVQAQSEEKPKLVVGIMVDAMKYDYLTRYWNHYGDGGFKKLVNEGYSCRNLHYNYIPTFTGCGHASVYTGSTPRVHGVIGNDWFDRENRRMIYCAEDYSVKSVGHDTPKGQMSPQNMLASTMTDELKLSGNKKGKVIALSAKDRGATLPGGHTADAAYWMTDRWISSSYYMKELPQWVNDFNSNTDKHIPDQWNTLKPIENYVESAADDNEYEYTYNGKDRPVFPYDLKKLMPENGNISMIKSTPFGNTITTEFAKSAVLNEDLGQDEDTDFLAISYSSPDYIFHMFGPQAVELQDNYMRLDLELEGLLDFLDKEVGEGEYLVFLTSDHGGAWVPAHMKDHKIPGGIVDSQFLVDATNEFLLNRFNLENLILNYSNDQLFLDVIRIEQSGRDPEQVARALADFVLELEGVAEAYTAWDLKRTSFTEGAIARIQNGFHHKRSGEVTILYQPGWIEYGGKGSTHGSGYVYDTHVPALFYGWGVQPGYTDRRYSITDIAPTVCTLLQISLPNAAEGNPIRQLTGQKR